MRRRFAEHLHGNDLGVRCNALHEYRGDCMVVSAVSVGDRGVSCRDAFHMGAVLALGIVVMGDVQIIVHVVVAKGILELTYSWSDVTLVT